MRRTAINLTLRPDTLAAVRAVAEREGSNPSRVVERIVREHLVPATPVPQTSTTTTTTDP